ncbi:Ataxin-2 [Oryzias melastigma]|uniref:Ataxin-2 n=1 Tax=Oryzias melastigma TaxID=30732 RepID=A0A834CIC2_ORYME|nr:Ataxin-2 [Oryzias melastigma]
MGSPSKPEAPRPLRARVLFTPSISCHNRNPGHARIYTSFTELQCRTPNQRNNHKDPAGLPVEIAVSQAVVTPLVGPPPVPGEAAVEDRIWAGEDTVVIFSGVYANMRMVHVLTSVVGTKCELEVKNGSVYEGVFKTYGPECDLVLDAAHRKSPEPSIGPRKEDIVESIIFKASDVVVVTFKDVDPNFARKDNFTDAAVTGRINGEHKEKDLEPWDGGDAHNSDSLESLDTDVSNGWDPNDMFKYNEEKYGVLSTYDSSLSTYTLPLERDNSEEFLKREARAAQLAEEIEASASYKARVALENDERTEEEKYTAVVRGEREAHALSRENKYVPPGQRNREPLSWGTGRQNSPRLGQGSVGPSAPRAGPHDYSPNSGTDQRVVNGGPPRMSPKSQRTPRSHRVPPSRIGGIPPGVDLISHNSSGEAQTAPPNRNNSSGGTWSSVVSGAHRPRSPRQNSMGGSSPGSSSLPSPQMGATEALTSAPSPTTTSPTPSMVTSPTGDAKECRIQETRQTPPSANKDIKSLDSSPSINRAVCKGPPSMPSDHRKQIDNLKKFSVDFKLQSSSNSDSSFEVSTKPVRDPADKPKDLPLDKASAPLKLRRFLPTTSSNTSKPDSPAALSPSPSAADPKRTGLDVTSQGVQTSTLSGSKHEEKEEKKEAVQDQVRKSTLNPNANEFKPRFNTQPKPANTPTPPRPQGQPSPSIVVPPPQTVYGQPVCFPQMYPLTPVSPGVQSPAMYQVQMPHMTVSQSKPFRPGKVPNMAQQRSDQHHPPGTPTMMHPATAAGPQIVAPSQAYSAQYFTCSPQQFTSQPLVQQMPHYQSQAQHVFSPVMQGGTRMMAPPTHGQPSLVSSSTTQYPEQTHTMYVSAGPMPQQYPHPSATLHPHPQHPQPSATPTGQGQQGGPSSARRSPQPPRCQPRAALSAPTGRSSSRSSSGPPHGQPAPTAADVLRFGSHAPLNDARPKPSVPPGVLPLCPAGCLHPPSAGAARLQPQPHRSRAAGPHAVWDGAVTPRGAYPRPHDAHGHPGSSRGSAGTHGPDCSEPNPSFFHHTFLLLGTSTSATSSAAAVDRGRQRAEGPALHHASQPEPSSAGHEEETEPPLPPSSLLSSLPDKLHIRPPPPSQTRQ